jgi:Tfp pilus assembly protein FimT
MKEMGKQMDRGFSLLEAVIVVGLVAIIVAVSVPTLYRSYQSYRAQTAVERITMNLRFARLAAVEKRIFYRVVIDESNDTYQIQMNKAKDGTTWVRYKNADTSMPDDGLDILAGGLTQITYNARGAANTSGTIRVQSTEFTHRINVFTSGAVTKQLE